MRVSNPFTKLYEGFFFPLRDTKPPASYPVHFKKLERTFSGGFVTTPHPTSRLCYTLLRFWGTIEIG